MQSLIEQEGPEAALAVKELHYSLSVLILYAAELLVAPRQNQQQHRYLLLFVQESPYWQPGPATPTT